MSEQINNDKKKEIVLSGIRATGNLHLGNYYGALSKFVRMQDDPESKYDNLFFIADLHALTTNPSPAELHENVKNILAEYLAAGLDPEKSTLFVQSDVPEVSELYLLLNMHVGIGELMRTASFKDKARKQLGIKSDSDNIETEIIGNDSNKRVNAGLLTYPTLMAVDILIQKAHYVPVGKDQEQHLELTRRFARRFNSFYGVDLFPEPVNFNFGGNAVKVPGLDGSGKMGKSEGNCIYLIDDEKTLRKKVMRAVTDEGPKVPNQEVSQPIANLFTLMELTSSPETVKQYRDAYADCSIRYGDLKKQLAEDILKVTLPIRERILDIRSNDEYLARVVARGAEKARERAAKTLKEAREIMGIRKFY